MVALEGVLVKPFTVWINQSQIQEVITDSSLFCGTYIQIIRFLFINPQVFQILPVLYMSKIILDIFHPLFWVISRSFFVVVVVVNLYLFFKLNLFYLFLFYHHHPLLHHFPQVQDYSRHFSSFILDCS